MLVAAAVWPPSCAGIPWLLHRPVLLLRLLLPRRLLLLTRLLLAACVLMMPLGLLAAPGG